MGGDTTMPSVCLVQLPISSNKLQPFCYIIRWSTTWISLKDRTISATLCNIVGLSSKETFLLSEWQLLILFSKLLLHMVLSVLLTVCIDQLWFDYQYWSLQCEVWDRGDQWGEPWKCAGKAPGPPYKPLPPLCQLYCVCSGSSFVLWHLILTILHKHSFFQVQLVVVLILKLQQISIVLKSLGLQVERESQVEWGFLFLVV